MADVAIERTDAAPRTARKRASLRTALKRKSTAAFLMTLPLILLIVILVIYPAFYSLHLATLNKSMQRFIGFGNFAVPVQARDLLAGGPAILHFRDHRRVLQGADRLHRRPLRPQHSGQGPAQMARHAAGAVGDPAGHEHAGVVVAVRSRRTAPSTICWRASASTGFHGPARPAGPDSRSSWSISGSAPRSS